MYVPSCSQITRVGKHFLYQHIELLVITIKHYKICIISPSHPVIFIYRVFNFAKVFLFINVVYIHFLCLC
jgi:hypothetical protein